MLTAEIESTMLRDLTKFGVWILRTSGAPSATDGVNIAGKGSLCIDSANGKLYINTGVIGAPVWTLVGAQT